MHRRPGSTADFEQRLARLMEMQRLKREALASRGTGRGHSGETAGKSEDKSVDRPQAGHRQEA